MKEGCFMPRNRELPNTAQAELEQFLSEFVAPVEGIMNSLRKDGLIVDGGKPGFVYDSDADNGKGKDYLERYVLARNVVDFRGLTSYGVLENHIYGCEWRIKYPDGEYLAFIRLYPINNYTSPSATVEYLVLEPGKDATETIMVDDCSNPAERKRVVDYIRNGIESIRTVSDARRAQRQNQR
jgi:hypothetical protein